MSWEDFKRVFEDRMGLREDCCVDGCPESAAYDQYACKFHVVELRAKARQEIFPALAMLDFLDWQKELPVDLRKWPEDA